jgi:hypothetical protein
MEICPTARDFDMFQTSPGAAGAAGFDAVKIFHTAIPPFTFDKKFAIIIAGSKIADKGAP